MRNGDLYREELAHWAEGRVGVHVRSLVREHADQEQKTFEHIQNHLLCVNNREILCFFSRRFDLWPLCGSEGASLDRVELHPVMTACIAEFIYLFIQEVIKLYTFDFFGELVNFKRGM